MIQYFLSFLFLTACCYQLNAQAKPLATTPLSNSESIQIDSTKLKITDDLADEKNALKSLILPGWGQVVNKQPAKGILFLGAVAGGTKLFLDRRKTFKQYSDAYSSRLNNYNTPIDQFKDLTLKQLYTARQEKMNEKDVVTAATAYVYLMNLADAAAMYKIKKIDDPKKHNATRAAYYSALLPGLGQAYNKKYWKIPIVYAGIGTSLYFAKNNRDFYRNYKTEIEFRSVGETTGFRSRLSEQKLKDGLEQWRKYRDLAYGSAAAVYLLNILDATVDAHLYGFNVDDDFSLHPSPALQLVDGQIYYGINLSFDFASSKK